MLNYLFLSKFATEQCYEEDKYVKCVIIFTTLGELRKVLFLTPSVCRFLSVYEISGEPLNGFAPNSHRRRVCSLARMSLKVKVTGTKTEFSAACLNFYVR